MDKSPFVEQPLILKENVEYFVKEPGARDTVSTEGAPEYIYAIEESAELIQSITKLARHKGHVANLTAEMAHLYITMANLRQMYDISLPMLQDAIDRKMYEYNLKAASDVQSPELTKEIISMPIRKALIELQWNTSGDTVKATVYVLLKTLFDECDANKKFISMSFNKVSYGDGSANYIFVIDIRDGIPSDSYSHIVDIAKTLHESWNWKLNLFDRS